MESARNSGSRDSLRAYLGMIPDYATEVVGVKLSGLRSGSPADKAGLKGGDVIVEFAGQQVKTPTTTRMRWTRPKSASRSRSSSNEMANA